MVLIVRAARALLSDSSANELGRHTATEIAISMERGERLLYHQIHPLKLFTDVTTAIAAAGLLWTHRLGLAVLIGWVPSIAVSAALLRWADLEPYRASAFGRYVRRFMTRRVELARFAGLILLWGGSWLRRPALIAAGAAGILACWLAGIRNPVSNDPAV